MNNAEIGQGDIHQSEASRKAITKDINPLMGYYMTGRATLNEVVKSVYEVYKKTNIIYDWGLTGIAIFTTGAVRQNMDNNSDEEQTRVKESLVYEQIIDDGVKLGIKPAENVLGLRVEAMSVIYQLLLVQGS